MIYVKYEWRKCKCQITTEQAPQKTAARKASRRKAVAAAINSAMEKETPAATVAGSTGTTASNTRAKAAVGKTRRSKQGGFEIDVCSGNVFLA